MENLKFNTLDINCASFYRQYIISLKESRKSSLTVAAYQVDLLYFLEFISKNSICLKLSLENYSNEIHDQFFNYLNANGRTTKSSLRRTEMAIRTFIRFLIYKKFITHSPFLSRKYYRNSKDKKLIISEFNYRKICDNLKKLSMNNDKKAIRDIAIVLIIGECGLKSSELSKLTWGDIQSKNEFRYLRIGGKKERFVIINSEIYKALNKLRKTRVNMKLSTSPQSKLFFSYIDGNKINNDISRHGIKNIVNSISENILGCHYSPENLKYKINY